MVADIAAVVEVEAKIHKVESSRDDLFFVNFVWRMLDNIHR